MATDDKMIAATLAAALLNKQVANDQVAPSADHLVKLYFECLEALHAERQRRVTPAQGGTFMLVDPLEETEG
jgi:hypothetical protein